MDVELDDDVEELLNAELELQNKVDRTKFNTRRIRKGVRLYYKQKRHTLS